jgi:hypothetical protein
MSRMRHSFWKGGRVREGRTGRKADKMRTLQRASKAAGRQGELPSSCGLWKTFAAISLLKFSRASGNSLSYQCCRPELSPYSESRSLFLLPLIPAFFENLYTHNFRFIAIAIASEPSSIPAISTLVTGKDSFLVLTPSEAESRFGPSSKGGGIGIAEWIYNESKRPSR